MTGSRFLAGISLLLIVASAGQAETFYVRNGGDDAADGRSHDTAWASLDRVNDFLFAPGDRVLFHEGDRWQGQLVVDWAGDADRRAIVGAYHLEDGAPVYGFTTRRPVIDGNDEIPGEYDGLLRVETSRVRVENLEVINSEGRGIQFENADDGAVVDCVTRNTYKSGIKFVNSDYAVARGNEVTRAGLAHPEDGTTWGGAIELVASDSGRISDNTVWEVYGEGINANDGSRGALIEDNRLFGVRAVGIYLDAAPDATVRRNLVVGTANSEYWRVAEATGPGIALNNEKYHYEPHGGSMQTSVQTTGARIYANLVAYTSSGVAFWGQLEETSFDDVLVLNNTFVDNDVQVRLGSDPKPNGVIANNILLSISPGTSDTDAEDSELAGMVAHDNYLSGGDPGGGWSDSGNVYEGLELVRMTGWRTLAQRDDVSWKDFLVQPGSSSVGAGDVGALGLGDAGFGLDFNGESHNEPPDIGALRFSEAPSQVPKKPTQVQGTP